MLVKKKLTCLCPISCSIHNSSFLVTLIFKHFVYFLHLLFVEVKCFCENHQGLGCTMPKVSEQADGQRLFIAPKCVVQKDCHSSIIALCHPKTKTLTKFLVTKNSNESKLFEIKKHCESDSSWFVDDFVKSDGALLLATPFDPMFFALEAFRSANPGKFVILDQVVESQDVLDCLSNNNLDNIADSTGSDGLKAYRFNEEMTLRWLKMKAERLMKVISETGIFVWDKSEDDGSCDKHEPIRYACGMIGDYIEEDLYVKMLEFLQIPRKTDKRKSSGGNPAAKKAKVEASEDYSKITAEKNNAKKAKLSRSQKLLDKVDKKGMKRLDCFFKPKTKN